MRGLVLGLGVVFLCVPLLSCSRTRSAAPDPSLSAATISYKLPETKVTVSLTVLIKTCGDNTATLEPSADVQTSLVPGPVFTLNGSSLSSWTTFQDLTVQLSDSGTIKSVNSQSQDQTGSIITNLLKTAVSVAAIAATGGPVEGVTCSANTKKAAEKSKALEDAISDLRSQVARLEDSLAAANKADKETSGLSKQIAAKQSDTNQLATALATLRSGPDLTVTLPAQELSLTERYGTISWQTQKFINQWKPLKAKDIGALFTIGYCLNEAKSASCKISDIENSPNAKVPVEADANCPDDKTCSSTLVFRDPKNVNLTVITYGEGYSDQSQTLKSVPLIIPQWGKFTYLGFKAGFGENHTVGIDLDAYGNKTKLSWKSDATANNITGSVANIASSANDLSAKVGDLAAQKVEIDQLNTEKSLNQLRACKKILDAGGFNCPTQ